MPRIAAEGEGAEARLSLVWSGLPVPMDRLEAWLSEPPDPMQPELTGHEILAAHATGIWTEMRNGEARLVLPLPLATGRADESGLTYDFALPGGGEGPELTAVLELLPGLDQGQLDGLVQAFQDRLSQRTVVAEKVDSLEVALEAVEI